MYEFLYFTTILIHVGLRFLFLQRYKVSNTNLIVTAIDELAYKAQGRRNTVPWNARTLKVLATFNGDEKITESRFPTWYHRRSNSQPFSCSVNAWIRGKYDTFVPVCLHLLAHATVFSTVTGRRRKIAEVINARSLSIRDYGNRNMKACQN